MSIVTRYILPLFGLISLCACVQVQERRTTSVNGQPVLTQESTTQVLFVPGVGVF